MLHRPDLIVACVRQGTKYGPEYVTRLRDGISRHVSLPHRFVCFTDDPMEGIDCRPIPDGLEGWWAKMALFRADAFPAGSRVLYLDLDTVLCRPIDAIASHPADFAILRSFGVPGRYGSGVMLWTAGQETAIWERWCAAGQPRPPGGDQALITEYRPGAAILQDLFPGRLVSFKVHCLDGLPEEAAIINFPGEPKPHRGPDWIASLWRDATANHAEGRTAP